MIDYNKIWESINNESKNGRVDLQIARQIPSTGIFSAFLASDFRKGLRLLYITIEREQLEAIDNLPRFKGLDISIITTSLGEFTNQNFIKFTQSIPNIDNVFELVISDICENVIQLQKPNTLHSTLFKVLNEWKLFFEKEETDSLSLESQKGLFGELHFLKEYLFQKYTFAESVTYWTGCEKTNHDFQIHKKAIEIKATASKQHKKIIISSEKQLDTTGLENLYLSIISLNSHSNMPESTLPSLVNAICGQINNDPVALFNFQTRLTKYGYFQKDANIYKTGFTVSEMKLFEVTENFPRLIQQNLPTGVGDVQYSVVLAACDRFELKDDILNYI